MVTIFSLRGLGISNTAHRRRDREAKGPHRLVLLLLSLLLLSLLLFSLLLLHSFSGAQSDTGMPFHMRGGTTREESGGESAGCGVCVQPPSTVAGVADAVAAASAAAAAVATASVASVASACSPLSASGAAESACEGERAAVGMVWVLAVAAVAATGAGAAAVAVDVSSAGAACPCGFAALVSLAAFPVVSDTVPDLAFPLATAAAAGGAETAAIFRRGTKAAKESAAVAAASSAAQAASSGLGTFNIAWPSSDPHISSSCCC